VLKTVLKDKTSNNALSFIPKAVSKQSFLGNYDASSGGGSGFITI